MATRDELKSRASQIKNEVEEGRNTANRIGGLFEDFADSVATKTELDDFQTSIDGQLKQQKENVDNKLKETDEQLATLGSKTEYTTWSQDVDYKGVRPYIDLGVLNKGTKLRVSGSNVENPSGAYWLFTLSGTSYTFPWGQEATVDITETKEYRLWTNLSPQHDTSGLKYHVEVVNYGTTIKEILDKIDDNKKNISNLSSDVSLLENNGYMKQGRVIDILNNTSKKISIGTFKEGDNIVLDIISVESTVLDWSTYAWNILIMDSANKTLAITNGTVQQISAILANDTEVFIAVNTLNIKLAFDVVYKAQRTGSITELETCVHTLNSVWGKYGSGTAKNIFDFNAKKFTRVNVSSQQRTFLGVLPKGTTINVSFLNSRITGSILCQIQDLSKGVLTFFWTYEKKSTSYTLTEQADIAINENFAPDTNASYDFEIVYGTNIPDETKIVTWKDSVIKESGIIRTLHLNASNSGKYTFGVGLVDWRNTAIINRTFDVNINSGEQTIDISREKIIVNENDKLFVFINKNGNDCIKCIDNASATEKFIIGDVSGVLEDYQGELLLEANVVNVDSIFAIQEDVQNIDSKIDNNTEQIQDLQSKINVIKDNNGNNYRLAIVGGNVVALPIIYKKALIMGNSLCVGIYQRGDDGSWITPYGMAASKNTLDFAAQVCEGLKIKDSTSTFKRKSIYEFERNFDIDLDDHFKDITSWDFDLIIYQGGENVQESDRSRYKEGLLRLVSYLKGKCPSAEFVITGIILDDFASMEAAAKSVANAYGAKYVYINGHTPDVQIGKTKVYMQEGAYYITKPIWATHPNDLGFLRIANRILSTVGYATVNMERKLNINSEVRFDAPSVYVVNGIVSIKTYGAAQPTISVKDSSNRDISISHINLASYDSSYKEDGATFVSYFEMPNSDVSVTIA